MWGEKLIRDFFFTSGKNMQIKFAVVKKCSVEHKFLHKCKGTWKQEILSRVFLLHIVCRNYFFREITVLLLKSSSRDSRSETISPDRSIIDWQDLIWDHIFSDHFKRLCNSLEKILRFIESLLGFLANSHRCVSDARKMI